jgi:predicted HTH transcriptional regulator
VIDIKTIIVSGEHSKLEAKQAANGVPNRETLANCVIHADYYGRQGIVIEKRPEKISFANPGIFRPNMNEVFDGGISDPRNPFIFKMFALIDIGERAGSGLFNIRTIWQEQGWQEPVWEEKFSPERLILSVPIESFEKGTVNPEKGTVNLEKGTVNPEKGTVNLTENQQSILNNITQNSSITTKELSEVVGISLSKIKENISKLKQNGLLERIGSDKNGYWQITGK